MLRQFQKQYADQLAVNGGQAVYVQWARSLDVILAREACYVGTALLTPACACV